MISAIIPYPNNPGKVKIGRSKPTVQWGFEKYGEKEWEPGWINLKYDTDWLAIPHQWFIVERHTCTSPHRSRRPREICKYQERLTTHLGALRRDDIDHLPVCREKRVELGA